MVFKYFREELKDAQSQGWRAEGRLVARNCIIAAAAAFCPLGILIGVLVLVLSEYVNGMPWIMRQTAFYYPMSAMAGIGLGIWLMDKGYYTAAIVTATLPFMWVPVFLASAGYWIVA